MFEILIMHFEDKYLGTQLNMISENMLQKRGTKMYKNIIFMCNIHLIYLYYCY